MTRGDAAAAGGVTAEAVLQDATATSASICYRIQISYSRQQTIAIAQTHRYLKKALSIFHVKGKNVIYWYIFV